MFDKCMKTADATINTYLSASKFVKALVALSIIEPLTVIWRLVSPREFGLQRLNEILQITHGDDVVNAISMPVLGAIVNTPARDDTAATSAIKSILEAIWSTPFLMLRVLTVLKSRQLHDTQTLLVFLMCSLSLHIAVDDSTMLSMVETLQVQGVNDVAALQAMLQRSNTSMLTGDLSTLAMLNQPGGRHENDHLDFRRIRIVPLPSEFESSSAPFLPMPAGGDGFLRDDPSTRLIDRAFRLLREDMLSSFRDDNLSNMAQFLSALIGRMERKPIPQIVLSLNAPSEITKLSAFNQKEYWSRQKWLHKNSLICVCKGNRPLLFGEIVKCMMEEGKNDDNDSPKRHLSFSVGISVEDERSWTTLLDLKVLSTDASVQLVAACSGFFSYQPTLTALQRLPDHVPAVQSLIEPSPESNMVLDDDIALDNACLTSRQFGDNIYENVMRLDTAQRRAFALATNPEEKLALIQGPPGTGKSLIGVLIALALSTNPTTRILCVCYKNKQVDQFLEALLDAGLTDIVRIGGRCTSDRLAPYVLRHHHHHGLESHYRLRERDLYQLLNDNEHDLNELFDLIDARSTDDWRHFESHLRPDQYCQFDIETDDTAETSSDLWNLWQSGQFLHNRSSPLWKLPIRQRRVLVKKWQNEIVRKTINVIANKLVLQRQLLEETYAIHKKSVLPLLRKAKVIGCTATGAAKNADLFHDVHCDVVIFEEAGELLEANVLSSISVHTERVVMIGDHMQLRPKLADHRLSVESGNGFDLNRSTFERMISEKHRFVCLQTQHRMRPELSNIVRDLMYPTLLDGRSVLSYPHVRGLAHDILFIHHDYPESGGSTSKGDSDEQPSLSKDNPSEAEFVVAAALYLYQCGHRTDQMVILTPYLDQVLNIKSLLNRANFDVLMGDGDQCELSELIQEQHDGITEPPQSKEKRRGAIKVSTVDNFQGQQADVVLVSLVRNNLEGRIGFLRERERINVLLTRARHGLLLFGHRGCLHRASTVWKGVLKRIRWYPGLPTYCERHDKYSLIRTAAEFGSLAPNGGCAEPCRGLLECGHYCSSICHDGETSPHSNCTYEVSERCPAGHAIVRLCSEQHTPICQVTVDDICALCSNNITRQCHIPIEQVECLHCNFNRTRQQIQEDIARKKKLVQEDAERRRHDEQALIEEAQRTAEAEREEILKNTEEISKQQIAIYNSNSVSNAKETERAVKLREEALQMLQEVRCGICFDDVKRAVCVSCRSEVPDQQHLFCRDCFGDLVANDAEEDIGILTKRKGMIVCPEIRTGNCISAPFTDQDIANNVAKPIFDKYMNSKKRLLEKEMNKEVDKTVKKIVELKLKRLEAETASSEAAEMIMAFVTPSCPKCRMAFIDFEGCAALTCHHCSCKFCAFCSKDCGAMVHDHVSSCKYNTPKGLYIDLAVWEQLRLVWVHDQIVPILRRMDSGTRVKTLQDCRWLSESGIDPNGLLADAESSGKVMF